MPCGWPSGEHNTDSSQSSTIQEPKQSGGMSVDNIKRPTRMGEQPQYRERAAKAPIAREGVPLRASPVTRVPGDMCGTPAVQTVAVEEQLSR